ncbi:MAG: hypothetical protein AAF408_10675 [Pseudomonadota bacterium]
MNLLKTALLSAALTATSVSFSAADEDRATPENPVLEALRATALEQGLVRVIVALAEPDQASDIDADAQIEVAKLHLQSALPMDDAPLVEIIEDQPLVVMEVSPRGLAWLEQSQVVAQIVPDASIGLVPDGNSPVIEGPAPNVGGTDDFAAPQDDSQ